MALLWKIPGTNTVIALWHQEMSSYLGVAISDAQDSKLYLEEITTGVCLQKCLQNSLSYHVITAS